MSARQQPDQPTVARLVRSAVGRDAVRVRRITEGGDHHAWLVDEDLVARFASDVAATARLRREVALRDLVRPRLATPVPSSVATGSWARGLGFTLDRRLPGTSAEVAPIPPSVMVELAALLMGLGSVSIKAARRIGIPDQPARDLHILRRRALTAARHLRGAGELTATQLRRIQDAEPPAAASPEHVVLVHGDLKGEHLLIDQGRVSGVLDWTDAELGDPATDVAGLAIAIGADAVEHVAAGHDHPTRHRGVQLARWDAILRLEQRLSGHDVGPLPLLRRQLQRALRSTALDADAAPRPCTDG
jgi:aminoglycoside phosphotransferase (APT) family kinase protein